MPLMSKRELLRTLTCVWGAGTLVQGMPFAGSERHPLLEPYDIRGRQMGRAFAAWRTSRVQHVGVLWRATML
jgi:hypothetical protein